MWVHEDPIRFEGGMEGPGPRATPSVVENQVYTLGATGLLNCLEAATGRRLWFVNIQEENGGAALTYGVCGSPLVTQDLVLVSPTGANGNALAAYDRKTGARVWQAGRAQASYSSPLLTRLVGVEQVLLHDSEGVTSYDPSQGQVLWHFPWANEKKIHASQPIPNAGAPDRVLVSTGYGKGSALFQVERKDQEGWSVQTLWTSREMRTKFTTPVIHKGHVYGLDDGILACMDLESGRRRWKEGRYGHGQVLLAGSLLLIQTERGPVVLVLPFSQSFYELGQIPALSSKTWNNPALAGRFLLLRNDREAVCYELPSAIQFGE
jgi:outer membrane protein assembly factor BamB